MSDRDDRIYRQKRVARGAKICVLPVFVFWAAIDFSFAHAEYRYRLTSQDAAKISTVIGQMQRHMVRPQETLLDIARAYDLGISVLMAFYPAQDPWLLTAGHQMQIPAMWVLPSSQHQDIVINVPEMRLYHFHPKQGTISTYPVTVGAKETPTPLGTFQVIAREIDPAWYIPQKLQDKYQTKIIQAGDDNPVGKYWLGLSAQGYGIHGTNNAWSVGRVLSNGCIRLYPEDIETLFPVVPQGTVVEIVYEPVKFGFRNRLIFMEVHDDPYGLIANLEQHTRNLAAKMAIGNLVDWDKVSIAMEEKHGAPVPVGTLPEGGDDSMSLHKAAKRRKHP